jgi:hypothetical protein
MAKDDLTTALYRNRVGRGRDEKVVSKPGDPPVGRIRFAFDAFAAFTAFLLGAALFFQVVVMLGFS